jgi:hypothetical protein
MTETITVARARTVRCDPASRVTRSLLGYGVLAGPVYLAVALGQALTRDGFDLTRHAASLLSNGSLGWIQITNFVVGGAMTIAGAAGLRRAWRGGPAGTWAPRLLGVYGASLVAAGALRADPSLGFPAGTPDGPGQVSWHGVAHLACGGVGFLALIAACFVVARRFAGQRRPGWAWYSRATGVAFLAGFAGVASGSEAAVASLGFWAAVALAWAWLSAVSASVSRGVRDGDGEAAA